MTWKCLHLKHVFNPFRMSIFIYKFVYKNVIFVTRGKPEGTYYTSHVVPETNLQHFLEALMLRHIVKFKKQIYLTLVFID